MATNPPPVGPATPAAPKRLRKVRLALLPALGLLLAATVIASWITSDVVEQIASLRQQGNANSPINGHKNLVDVSPWQTAQTLASLARSMEEVNYAHEAEHLADHEVDQAFASALRQANIQHRTYTGDAAALAQHVQQLQKVVDDDNLAIKNLSNAPGGTNDDDLEVLKAQQSLDSDILDDAQAQLAQATGDKRTEIQQELTTHEADMAKYDQEIQHSSASANTTVRQHSTLLDRIEAWLSQSSRYKMLLQAKELTQSNAAALKTQYATLQASSQAPITAQPNASATPPTDRASKLNALRERSEQVQLVNIVNDRIQTEQQLATVYGQWANQVQLQHRLLLHLILQSLTLILVILIAVVLGNRLVRHLLDRPNLDPRRMQTLRTILELSVQLLGAVAILMVCFGIPKQASTILGFTTAGLTVALQDFILAFLGWFVLMGRNGIRLGDSVEINGVAGEVAEVGLFRTTILETGSSADTGHPTGRRVALLNKFAVNGQYFNFSTEGQWMWDEISVNIPESANSYSLIEKIHKAVLKETEEDAQHAEAEWKHAARLRGLSQFTASAQVNLRPAASGVNILIRYVTRAGNRFEMRNRLYQCAIDLLHAPAEGSEAVAGAN